MNNKIVISIIEKLVYTLYSNYILNTEIIFIKYTMISYIYLVYESDI